MSSLARRDLHAEFADRFIREGLAPLRPGDPVSTFRAMVCLAKVHEYALVVDMMDLDLELFPSTYVDGYEGHPVGQMPDFEDASVHEVIESMVDSGAICWDGDGEFCWNRPEAVRPSDVVLTDDDEGCDPVWFRLGAHVAQD